jgi:hypothetical protein
MPTTVDDQLKCWDEVQGDFGQSAGLLIGNGASRAVWHKFEYRSLYEEAQDGIEHPLLPEDQEIFECLNTENFEQVLSGLSTTSRITRILHQNNAPIQERYEHIQNALVEAVRSVHVPWGVVPNDTLLKIRGALRQFDSVFSTNYDFLVYWAIMAQESGQGFKDYFWRLTTVPPSFWSSDQTQS